MYLTFITSLVRLIRSGQNLIWKDWLTGLIGRKGIKRERKRQPMILSGCLFLVYFCSCTVHSQTRASVLCCLLSQTDRSLDSQTRATALHRLLSQAVCSLMTQENKCRLFGGACFSSAFITCLLSLRSRPFWIRLVLYRL